jgi:hypothetical protein
MDFLKKNGFAVSLSALGVLALVLYYVMVIGKLWGGDLSKAREDLDKLQKDYGRYARQTPAPTEKSMAVAEAGIKAWNEALEEGRKFYDDRKAKFEQLPDDFGGTPDDVTGFKTFYETLLKKMRDTYLAAFKPKEVAAAPAAAPATPPPEATGTATESAAEPTQASAPAAAPTAVTPATATVPPPSPSPSAAAAAAAAAASPFPVIQAVPRFSSPEDVKRAGKELWVVSEVYRVLTDLKIGGLQEIRFPDREKGAVLEPGAHHNWIHAIVTVEMPLTDLEPFLAKLFQSDRVPFRLEKLNTVRKEEVVLTKMLIEQKGDADKPTEPPIVVIVDLAALNWVDAPAAAPAAEKSEKDSKK